jgi:hypothetical protein
LSWARSTQTMRGTKLLMRRSWHLVATERQGARGHGFTSNTIPKCVCPQEPLTLRMAAARFIETLENPQHSTFSCPASRSRATYNYSFVTLGLLYLLRNLISLRSLWIC